MIQKKKLNEKDSDFLYWQQQSISKRLEALQQIRDEYIGWKYDNRQGFQRVHSIVTQK